MNQEFTNAPRSGSAQPLAVMRSPLVDVAETSVEIGECLIPAVNDVRLALALSDVSARWRTSTGLKSEKVAAGAVSICQSNESRRLEMRAPARFGVVRLRHELVEKVREDVGCLRGELQAHYQLQDPTLRRLILLLLREGRDGYGSGSLFIEGVATALASYLVCHYSARSQNIGKFRGGMSRSTLRRCIDLMEAHLERDLRLSELAHEAGLSSSHFTRSFRRSTGKSPYQFLLHRRVERAKSLMRDDHVSLTEVALASGFADQHHLARVFRRVTGETPSSYRRSV